MEGHWKFLRGRGVLKAKILEAKYEAKLEFPEGRVGGGGGAKQKPFMGGVWIFSGTPHSEKGKYLSSSNMSQTYDLLNLSSDALPLNYGLTSMSFMTVAQW